MAAQPPAGSPVGARLQALDGLRGLALLGMLAFHGGLLQGGFLSIDVFFLLSGYLITSLLVRERVATGTVAVTAFWKRRARRLVPGLLALLVGVSIYAVLVASSTELARIRTASFATSAYVANWYAIAVGQGYWDHFAAPSPLNHAWTLAVEEQFYLVWPAVVLGVLALARGRIVILGIVTTLGSVASAVAMAVLYQPDAEPSRVYLGTDTRAYGLLLGATVGVVLGRRGAETAALGARGRTVVDVLAATSMVVLGVAWVRADGLAPWLYRGGFPALCVVAVPVIVAAAQPVATRVGRALSARPLQWLGTVSYGAYLWHWPIFITVHARFPELAPWPRFAIDLALTLPVAQLSWVVVERPILRRGLAALPHRALAPIAVVGVFALVLVTTTGAVAPPPDATTAVLAPLASVAADPSVPPTGGAGGAVGTSGPAGTGSSGGPVTVAPSGPRRLLVVGDSLGLYLGDELARPDAGRSVAGREVQAVNRSLAGCFLGRGTGRVRYQGRVIESEPEVCRTWAERWAADVAAFRPDDVLIISGNAGDGEREVDGRWLSTCSADFATWFGGELREAVAVLGATGARVHVTTVPYPRFPFLGRDLDASTDCMNRTITTALGASAPTPGTAPIAPSVTTVIDLAAWTCPTAEDCRREQDGAVLRPDGVHFQDGGARVAADWLVGELTR